MPAVIITGAEVLTYGEGSGALNGVASGDLNDAIARATDKIRQAALNHYTAASFESLTAENAPDEMKDAALALTLGIFTRGDASRPESITAAYDEAARYLGLLAGGKTHYDEAIDAILVKRAASVSSVKRRTRYAEKVFDRDNTSGAFDVRDESI